MFALFVCVCTGGGGAAEGGDGGRGEGAPQDQRRLRAGTYMMLNNYNTTYKHSAALHFVKSMLTMRTDRKPSFYRVSSEYTKSNNIF